MGVPTLNGLLGESACGPGAFGGKLVAADHVAKRVADLGIDEVRSVSTVPLDQLTGLESGVGRVGHSQDEGGRIDDA